MLKHIGIPTLDISGRTDWQSIVDREKNQYLGHVTTAMTADGSIPPRRSSHGGIFRSPEKTAKGSARSAPSRAAENRPPAFSVFREVISPSNLRMNFEFPYRTGMFYHYTTRTRVCKRARIGAMPVSMCKISER